ncbi:hypothetical protein BDF20DRAFT_910243 [Mycotypha africana]|uniref:uncharacterized protein n=1 Tax=Mycotypha africana TaxID=64632 RepID=UPI002300D732|nr:uncharacterized protein BDF20DRAFT_910243 [Mycotypha africana]KAI8987670.1 hypothetical protein BDF20DRAFT_910243 [Mycotypha africana]
MSSAYYYNQQQTGSVPPHMAQQNLAARGIPGQIGLNPLQGQYVQQQQQPQYRNQPSMMDSRKRGHSKATRQNLPVPEDVDEPSGDELDDISARDIAMARYKRNHDYLSEIFTPYNAEFIVSPPLDIVQTKEELEKQIDDYKERAEKRKKIFEDKLASIEQEQNKYWALLSKLNEAKALQDIDKSSEDLAKELGVKIEHTNKSIRVQSIPGIEEDHPAEPIANQSSSAASYKLEEQINAGSNSNNINNNQAMGTNNGITNTTLNTGNADHQQNIDVNTNDNSKPEMNTDISGSSDPSGGNNLSKQDEDTSMDDSFFNEMVNAEDDSAVNEFLNTE